jgi:hypothetical protein
MKPQLQEKRKEKDLQIFLLESNKSLMQSYFIAIKEFFSFFFVK